MVIIHLLYQIDLMSRNAIKTAHNVTTSCVTQCQTMDEIYDLYPLQ